MSITFIGPAGCCEIQWIRYALLRDNVLHHIEHRELSLRFAELYKVASALGGSAVPLSAQKLREQILQARELCALPIEQLAISARTQAVLSMQQNLPIGPPTEIVGDNFSIPWLHEESHTLQDVFGKFVDELLRITENATETDIVEAVES